MMSDGKSRARWPWILLVALVVLAVLVVVAELLARSILPGVVRGIVIGQLELPADQQLEVETDGILLPQLIGGQLDELRLSSESVTIGGITGAAEVTVTGAPLRGGDLDDVQGTVRIDQNQFTALVAASDLPIDKVAFAEPDVTASGSISVLGATIPVALTVTPGTDAGDLVLTPVELQVAGLALDAAQIADRFGDAGARLTQPQRVCIADQLPAGVTVTGLSIDGSSAVIDVDVDGAIVTDDALQDNGTCR